MRIYNLRCNISLFFNSILIIFRRTVLKVFKGSAENSGKCETVRYCESEGRVWPQALSLTCMV